MYYLDFDDLSSTKTACFDTIKNVYSLEAGNLVKYAYGLTLKATSPNNFERQNVKLVLQIFNEHVIQGLNHLGENKLQCAKETSDFIKLIYKWWCIMNVKSPFKGEHKRDPFQKPLTNDENNLFLDKFYYWLKAWNNWLSEPTCRLK